MRLLIASVAAVAAVAFAAPSFAQEAAAPAPTPVGQAQARHLGLLQHPEEHVVQVVVPQAGACDRQGAVLAQDQGQEGRPTPRAEDTSAQLTPPAAAPTPTPVAAGSPSTIAVPPLPQKTI